MVKDKRPLSIRMALEWAYMTEYAQVDLSDDRSHLRPSVGIEWVMLERLKVSNYRITGGGRSDPHPDAEIINAGITALGQMKGFRWLALFIAEHAANGSTPDWMQGEQPKIEPAEWKRGSKHARMAKSEILRRYHVSTWHPHPKNPKHRVQRRAEVIEEWTPCIWTTTMQEIEACRSTYDQWRVGLQFLRDKLKRDGDLETISLTDHLPVNRPWLQGSL